MTNQPNNPFEGPTKDEATQFALLLASGVPVLEALPYFRPDLGGTDLARESKRWQGSKLVQSAILAHQGKPWEGMTLEERVKFAVDKHYTEMAYFLFSHNYCDLAGADRQKADECRRVLEAKIAGMAGKMDAMSRFFEDVVGGKFKRAMPQPAALN